MPQYYGGNPNELIEQYMNPVIGVLADPKLKEQAWGLQRIQRFPATLLPGAAARTYGNNQNQWGLQWPDWPNFRWPDINPPPEFEGDSGENSTSEETIPTTEVTPTTLTSFSIVTDSFSQTVPTDTESPSIPTETPTFQETSWPKPPPYSEPETTSSSSSSEGSCDYINNDSGVITLVAPKARGDEILEAECFYCNNTNNSQIVCPTGLRTSDVRLIHAWIEGCTNKGSVGNIPLDPNDATETPDSGCPVYPDVCHCPEQSANPNNRLTYEWRWGDILAGETCCPCQAVNPSMVGAAAEGFLKVVSYWAVDWACCDGLLAIIKCRPDEQTCFFETTQYIKCCC